MVKVLLICASIIDNLRPMTCTASIQRTDLHVSLIFHRPLYALSLTPKALNIYQHYSLCISIKCLKLKSKNSLEKYDM